MERKKVLLLFGGESSEHEVSLASAKNVTDAIDDAKYELLFGFIDKGGKWWLRETFDAPSSQQLLPQLGEAYFITHPSGQTIRPDVILPILHGKNGEDGTVQGLAELLHIPIVGCGVEASAVAMDKVLSKEILEAQGIQTTPYKVYRKGEELPGFTELSTSLGNPLFVKPSRSGSSVGVNQVRSEQELHAAIAEAGKYDSVILIERGITGRELEVAVLGTPPNHRTSDVGEIIPDGAFYSYDAKYAKESHTKTLVAIELDDEIRAKIRMLSSQVYTTIGCEGLARVDFLLSTTNEIYVNEINTLPGFTNISMYPKMWEAQGLAYSDLIDVLIQDALKRDTMKANQTEG